MIRLNLKIKKSNVHIGQLPDGPLARAVAAFDLSGATPMDCMDFVRKLKEIYETERAQG